MACVTAGPVAGPSSIPLLSQGSWGSSLVPRPGCLADVKVGKRYMVKEEPDGLLPGWWSPSPVCRDPLTSSSRLGGVTICHPRSQALLSVDLVEVLMLLVGGPGGCLVPEPLLPTPHSLWGPGVAALLAWGPLSCLSTPHFILTS